MHPGARRGAHVSTDRVYSNFYRVPRLAASELSDEEALDRVMNPARNRYRLDVLNVSYHSPLMRSLHHATYVFEKKLSHTADSH